MDVRSMLRGDRLVRATLLGALACGCDTPKLDVVTPDNLTYEAEDRAPPGFIGTSDCPGWIRERNAEAALLNEVDVYGAHPGLPYDTSGYGTLRGHGGAGACGPSDYYTFKAVPRELSIVPFAPEKIYPADQRDAIYASFTGEVQPWGSDDDDYAGGDNAPLWVAPNIWLDWYLYGQRQADLLNAFAAPGYSIMPIEGRFPPVYPDSWPDVDDPADIYMLSTQDARGITWADWTRSEYTEVPMTIRKYHPGLGKFVKDYIWCPYEVTHARGTDPCMRHDSCEDNVQQKLVTYLGLPDDFLYCDSGAGQVTCHLMCNLKMAEEMALQGRVPFPSVAGLLACAAGSDYLTAPWCQWMHGHVEELGHPSNRPQDKGELVRYAQKHPGICKDTESPPCDPGTLGCEDEHIPVPCSPRDIGPEDTVEGFTVGTVKLVVRKWIRSDRAPTFGGDFGLHQAFGLVPSRIWDGLKLKLFEAVGPGGLPAWADLGDMRCRYLGPQDEVELDGVWVSRSVSAFIVDGFFLLECEARIPPGTWFTLELGRRVREDWMQGFGLVPFGSSYNSVSRLATTCVGCDIAPPLPGPGGGPPLIHPANFDPADIGVTHAYKSPPSGVMWLDIVDCEVRDYLNQYANPSVNPSFCARVQSQ